MGFVGRGPGRGRRVLLGLAALMLMGPGAATATSDTERAGDWLQVLVPVGAWGLTHARDDAEGRGQLYRAFGATFLATHALKLTVHAERPRSSATNSFPSGHTSAAFSGASFIQYRYGWGWGAPAYALAGFVGYSRVHSRAHYTRDVVAGAALAIGMTHLFTTRHEGVEVAPVLGADGAGLSLRMAF